MKRWKRPGRPALQVRGAIVINAPFDADRASPQSPSHVGGGIIVSLVAFCLEMTNNNNPDSRKKKKIQLGAVTEQ